MTRWTPEAVDRLKALWSEGQSASQIARELGNGVTRNAVIGKVHRLNLERRAPMPAPRPDAPPKPRAPRKPSMPPITRAAPAPPVRLVLVDPSPDTHCAIMDLDATTCRWPIGDPRADDFYFCGHTPRDGSPYCEYHVRQAYESVAARRASRRAPAWMRSQP